MEVDVIGCVGVYDCWDCGIGDLMSRKAIIISRYAMERAGDEATKRLGKFMFGGYADGMGIEELKEVITQETAPSPAPLEVPKVLEEFAYSPDFGDEYQCEFLDDEISPAFAERW